MSQKPLWKVLRQSDRDADFGENSRRILQVSQWLEKCHPNVQVLDEAPVNWNAVHAVLAELLAKTGDPAAAPLRAVVERIGRHIGVPISA